MNWISVEDQLPEPESGYTVFIIAISWKDTILDKGAWKSFTDIGRFNKHKGLFLNMDDALIEDDENTIVTHWCALPEPPKV